MEVGVPSERVFVGCLNDGEEDGAGKTGGHGGKVEEDVRREERVEVELGREDVRVVLMLVLKLESELERLNEGLGNDDGNAKVIVEGN
jgi:hypothetical protein